MADRVILHYKRVGETYTGQIQGGLSFSEASYATMMSIVHRELVERPGAGLVLQRTDHLGLLPVSVERQFVELLRTDPVAYIKLHSVPQRRINIDHSTRMSKLAQAEMKEAEEIRSPLRVGRNTLASAFGDYIYLKVDGTRIEHPVTGRWVPVEDVISWLSKFENATLPDGNEWLKVSVLALCQTGERMFYMPHPWNEFGVWISNTQLLDKHNKYTKEKEQCLSMQKIP